jgi:hypothetical protein
VTSFGHFIVLRWAKESARELNLLEGHGFSRAVNNTLCPALAAEVRSFAYG